MILEIKIPSPGESVTEVQLSSWLVKDEDYVKKDQELAEIESDKATLPLIAPQSGKIKILVPEGTTAKVGTVACSIDTSVIKMTQDTPLEAAPNVQQIVQKPEEKKEDVPQVNVPETSAAETEVAPPVSEKPSVKVTPIAQKMMEEHGLSIDDVLLGLKRISKSELEAVIQQQTETKPSVEPKIQPSAVTDRAEERKQMSALRKKLSERLVAVKNQTAMLTTFNEVDMSAVMDLRKKYQSQFEAKHKIKVGFMSFFTKAVTQALKLHPNVNSMIDGEEIVTPHYYDIAIAVQTDRGLMVPVLRNTENMSLADIEKGIAEMATKARAGRLSLDEMTGGTFTITNGGVFGSLLSTPIINPPQSAILGMHNIVDRPVAINGKVEIRPMMYIALSYDHRIIDGKDSVGFLVHVKQFIENPLKLLLEGPDPEKKLLDI